MKCKAAFMYGEWQIKKKKYLDMLLICEVTMGDLFLPSPWLFGSDQTNTNLSAQVWS